MKIFADDRLLSLGIISGTGSRHVGCGRDIQNVKKVLDILGIAPSKMLGLRQVHGDTIIPIITDDDLTAYKAAPAHEADAWLLGKAGWGCMILTADCAPLFVWDDKGRFVALAHCGWRGVVAGLPGKIAAAVKDKAGAGARLCAYIGPHINKCCFEVKEDVAARFGSSAVIHKDNKIFVDLSAEIKSQLTKEGIMSADIKHEQLARCTCCNKADFFSYRRDKMKDSLISLVYKI